MAELEPRMLGHDLLGDPAKADLLFVEALDQWDHGLLLGIREQLAPLADVEPKRSAPSERQPFLFLDRLGLRDPLTDPVMFELREHGGHRKECGGHPIGRHDPDFTPSDRPKTLTERESPFFQTVKSVGPQGEVIETQRLIEMS
jgi:hypothetical protein